jgi:hypothetical protein
MKRLVISFAIAFLAGAPAASAHLRSGTVAVDYKAAVTQPDTPAYTARIYQSDRVLNLVGKPGHTVAVIGYLDEPMFRLDAAGLWVNAASPTAVVAGLIPKGQRAAGARESWRLHRGRHSVSWRDSRAQGLPAGADAGVWRVPVVVDGHRHVLAGTLSRYAKPAIWQWLIVLGAYLTLAGAWAARGARWILPALATIAATVSVLLALVFWLDAYASYGTWLASIDEIFVAAAGLVLVVRGPPRWRPLAAIALGLLSIAVAISKGAIFLHPIVLAVVPGDVTRALASIAIADGIALVAITAAGQSRPLPRRRGIVPTA